MRTIKFRGKTKKYGWVKGCLIYCKKHPEDMIIQSIECESPLVVDSYYVDPETVGEFTGQLDIHTNEIYEDDLVKSESGRIGRVVYFKSPAFCGWDLIAVNSEGHAPVSWRYLEIVGNVHDNPELLEVSE